MTKYVVDFSFLLRTNYSARTYQRHTVCMSLLFTTVNTLPTTIISNSSSTAAIITNKPNVAIPTLSQDSSRSEITPGTASSTGYDADAVDGTGCAVSSCLYHTQRPCRVPLVDFPDPRADRHRCTLWMRVCGIQRLVAGRTRVCARHFEPGDFVDNCAPPVAVRGQCSVVRVRSDVVPTRQLVMNPLSWSLDASNHPASIGVTRASSAAKVALSHNDRSAAGSRDTAATTRAPSGVARRSSRARRRQRYSNLVKTLMDRGYGDDGDGASTATLEPRERAVLVQQALAEYERRRGHAPDPATGSSHITSAEHVSDHGETRARISAVDISTRQLSAAVDDAGIKEYGQVTTGDQCTDQYLNNNNTHIELSDSAVGSQLTDIDSIHSSSATLLSSALPHPPPDRLDTSLLDSNLTENRRNNNFYSVDSLSADNLLLESDGANDTTTAERILNIDLIVQPQIEVASDLTSCFSESANTTEHREVSLLPETSLIQSPCAPDIDRITLIVADDLAATSCDNSSDVVVLPATSDQSVVGESVGVDATRSSSPDSSAIPPSPPTPPLPPPPYTKLQLSEWLAQSTGLLQALQPPHAGRFSDVGSYTWSHQQQSQRGSRGSRSRASRRRRSVHRGSLTSASESELFPDSMPMDDSWGAHTSHTVSRMPHWLTDRSRELLRWRRNLHRLQRELDLEPSRAVLVKVPSSESGRIPLQKTPPTSDISSSSSVVQTLERTIYPLLVLRDEDEAKWCGSSVGGSLRDVSGPCHLSECLSAAATSAELTATPSTLVNALSLLHRQRLLNQQLYASLLRTGRQLKRTHALSYSANVCDSVGNGIGNTTDTFSNSGSNSGRRWSEIEIVRALELRRQCSPSVYGYVRTLYGDGRLPDIMTLSALAKRFSSGRGKLNASSSTDVAGDVPIDNRLDVAGLPVGAGISGAAVSSAHSVTDRFDRVSLIGSDSASSRSILSVTGSGTDPPLWECLSEYGDGCGGMLTQVSSSSSVPMVMVGEEGVSANGDTCSGATVSKRRHSSRDVMSVDGCDVVWSDASMLDGSSTLLGVPTPSERRPWPLTKLRTSSTLLETSRALYVPADGDGGLSASTRQPSTTTSTKRRRLDPAVVPRDSPEQLAVVSSVAGDTAELENSVPAASPLGSPQWLNAVTFSDDPIGGADDV